MALDMDEVEAQLRGELEEATEMVAKLTAALEAATAWRGQLLTALGVEWGTTMVVVRPDRPASFGRRKTNRNAAIVQAVRNGATTIDVGREHGISPSRVSQIIAAGG